MRNVTRVARNAAAARHAARRATAPNYRHRHHGRGSLGLERLLRMTGMEPTPNSESMNDPFTEMECELQLFCAA